MKIRKFLLISFATLALSVEQAYAADFMKEGIAQYNSGNYSEACGRFGGALSTDFNNATLHYYLGSCFVHMKQKESAIREFRIAHALDPDSEVGKYAKQALATYGYDPTGIASSAAAAAAETKKLDAQMSQLEGKPNPPAPKLSQLEQQAEDLKNLRAEQSRLASLDASRQGDLFIKNATQNLLDSMRYVWRGRVVQPTHLGQAEQAQIDGLKKMYDSQKNGYLQTGSEQSSHIQQTAESLRDQMNEQAKAGKLHLSTSGTNLYVRNYEMTPSDSSSASKTVTTPGNTPSFKVPPINSSAPLQAGHKVLNK